MVLVHSVYWCMCCMYLFTICIEIRKACLKVVLQGVIYLIHSLRIFCLIINSSNTLKFRYKNRPYGFSSLIIYIYLYKRKLQRFGYQHSYRCPYLSITCPYLLQKIFYLRTYHSFNSPFFQYSNSAILTLHSPSSPPSNFCLQHISLDA